MASITVFTRPFQVGFLGFTLLGSLAFGPLHLFAQAEESNTQAGQISARVTYQLTFDRF